MLASPAVAATKSLNGKCHILSDYKISLQTFHSPPPPPPSHLTGETGCFEKLSEFLRRLKEKVETDKERTKSEAICTLRLTCRGPNFCGTDPGVDSLMLTKPTSFGSQRVSYPSLALRGSLYLARAPLSVSFD